MRTIVATIVKITRIRNSYSGNPRFELTLQGGRTVRTAADHSVGYEIDSSFEGREMTLVLNGRGTVVDIETAA